MLVTWKDRRGQGRGNNRPTSGRQLAGNNPITPRFPTVGLGSQSHFAVLDGLDRDEQAPIHEDVDRVLDVYLDYTLMGDPPDVAKIFVNLVEPPNEAIEESDNYSGLNGHFSRISASALLVFYKSPPISTTDNSGPAITPADSLRPPPSAKLRSGGHALRLLLVCFSVLRRQRPRSCPEVSNTSTRFSLEVRIKFEGRRD
nr:hypothetical protein Iba_chr14bCG10260 [Ipomoea batatas]